MRYFLFCIALVAGCGSAPPAAQPANARPAAPAVSTTTFTLAKHGHTIGTLRVAAGTIGELTAVPLDPDGAELADVWAAVRTEGRVEVMVHHNPPLEIVTQHGRVTFKGIPTYSGMGPLVSYIYKPTDAKYLDGVAMWLALHGVEATRQPGGR